MKHYTKKCLALLLAAMLLLSTLPAAYASGLASSEDQAYQYGVLAGYRYTVSVDAPGEDNDGYLTDRDPIIRFGPMTYGEPIDANGQAVLTFHNVGSETLHFHFDSCPYAGIQWLGSDAGLIEPGDSAQLRITLKEYIPAMHDNVPFLLMERNSRVAFSPRLAVQVDPALVRVSAESALKVYGQTLSTADIAATVTGGVTDIAALEALGYTLESEGFAAGADVGIYPITVAATADASANYSVNTGETIASVTVEKATPKPVWVSASAIRSGDALSASTLDGVYQNPYSGEEVAGTFAWKDGQKAETVGDGETATFQKFYTFIPADETNYNTAEGTVELTVSGAELTAITPDPSAQLDVTYDGKPHPVTFSTNYGTVEVQYAPFDDAENWSLEAPTAVGSYHVRASVKAGDGYTAASFETVLTIRGVAIELRLAEPGAIVARQYNGSAEATLNAPKGQRPLSNAGRIQFSGTLSGDSLYIDYSKVTAVYDSPSVGTDKTVTVTVPKDAISGDIAHYGFEGQTFITTGNIFVLPEALGRFTDVSSDTWYADAVAWAAENGVAAGVTETSFAPGTACCRAQAVTFLWRAAGCPEPSKTSCPFTDVEPGSYYEKAVLWAVESGITAGTSETTFGPYNICTRAQIVTFLWRMEGQQSASASGAFADVGAGEYYETAVWWALENGVTAGMSATAFSPESVCTRSQVVSFLYRDLV